MSERKYVSYKIDEKLFSSLKEHYKDYEINNENEYISFFAKKGDLIISIYQGKKPEDKKVVFSGTNPLKEARLWNKDAEIKKPKIKNGPKKAEWVVLSEQIGSDEVGTGDFFGPITVAACHISEKNLPLLRELGVDDSKRLKDEDILRIGEVLINKIQYSQVALNNEKYNSLIDQGMNLNEMKAKLHNQVLINLVNKNLGCKTICVDKFCDIDKYYEYLKGTPEVVVNIDFRTKGESRFPSVAAASIIARYSFLKKMEKLSQKYNMKIPFGASPKVTEFAKKFVAKYGEKELLKIVKKNFVNLNEALSK